jgi:radical SAM superfamily enzyme YgiQ (UPF0313 family)
LISTYELGRQPFGLASPAAWLERDGCDVRCLDLAVQAFDEEARAATAAADLIAFHVPMHTATRLAARAVETIRRLNPRAHLCFYGLYAPLNERHLRQLGGATILGGEFEAPLVALARRLRAARGRREGGQAEPLVSLERQHFLTPRRAGLPGLERYARLRLPSGAERTVGYTEASRGCKHRCRHCPIVPVYGGRFRVVQADVVLADVRQQVAAGARHVTFGDPDFLNGPTHATTVVEALHREFPELTYDATIKIEHLLRHRDLMARLRETGCLFVTTAVESFDDRVLDRLDKGHTRADVIEVVHLAMEAGLHLNPTFVPFTPWIGRRGYLEFLAEIETLGLVDHVAPVQYAIRLLLPRGSRLLELDEVRRRVGGFDRERLAHTWTHADPGVESLHDAVAHAVHAAQHGGESRGAIFRRVWRLALEADDDRSPRQFESIRGAGAAPPATVPYLTEPWYC